MGIVQSFIKRLAQLLCRYRGKNFVEYIARTFEVFIRALDNEKFAMKHNGELRVLSIISRIRPNIIFDVGANIGEWSCAAARLNPSCLIHSFEIVPSTFEKLQLKTEEYGNVIPVKHGLSDSNGTIQVNIGSKSTVSTGSEIDKLGSDSKSYTDMIPGSVIKASDYMKEQGIDSVDFMKIDVEGMDFKVIKGLEEMLQNVRVIQFEYGMFNIASKDLLTDFFKQLSAYNFKIGKIYPRFVKFTDYHPTLENFRGSNFVAVSADEHDLIESLQSFGIE